jgi:hypothetical protein
MLLRPTTLSPIHVLTGRGALEADLPSPQCHTEPPVHGDMDTVLGHLWAEETAQRRGEIRLVGALEVRPHWSTRQLGIRRRPKMPPDSGERKALWPHMGD